MKQQIHHHLSAGLRAAGRRGDLPTRSGVCVLLFVFLFCLFCFISHLNFLWGEWVYSLLKDGFYFILFYFILFYFILFFKEGNNSNGRARSSPRALANRELS